MFDRITFDPNFMGGRACIRATPAAEPAFDYDVLEPGLILSAYPREAARLAALPVKAILNVCDFAEPAYGPGLPPGIQLIRWPFEDNWPVPFPWLAVAVLELADLGQRGIPVLVHCHLGRSRSPTVVALYWMARDGVDWPTSVRRLDASRLNNLRDDGQSPLANAALRGRVVECVRSFLAGDTSLLHQWRERAHRFTSACRQRVPNLAPPGAPWSLLEDGLALGRSMVPWDTLAQQGFDRILVVRACPDAEAGAPLPPGVPTAVYTFPVQERLDRAVLRAVVEQLDAWTRQGRRVFVLGPGEDFFAVAALCVWLMETRGWDAASAIWYVAGRHPGVYAFLDLLAEVNLEGLVLADPAEKG